MTDAPERIWAWPAKHMPQGVSLNGGPTATQIEYTRTVLIPAMLAEAEARGAAMEREACAKVVMDYPVPIGCTNSAVEIAAAIRARGQEGRG